MRYWDDRSHKRRARDLAKLKRAGPSRDPYDAVLIVCEGSKTEPNYFQEMRAELQLSNANIVITGKGGTDPLSVVNNAVVRFEADPVYDQVYCVFDQDTHATYRTAVDKVAATTLRKNGSGRQTDIVHFQAITSVPCFEYWLLLHYGYTAKPYKRVGSRSACDRLIHDLKHCGDLLDYCKGTKGLYRKTAPHLDDAIRNAERALCAAKTADTDNPTTHVHELVEYLLSLAKLRI